MHVYFNPYLFLIIMFPLKNSDITAQTGDLQV